MDTQRKPTVTVAFCAWNEGPNVSAIVQSILDQEEDTYKLSKILIISDGSEDDTVEKIKAFNDPRIDLRDYKIRQGKSHHLNEIYSGVTSDFLVQPDADVVMAHPRVISALIQPMIDNKNVGITGGNPRPSTPETFIESCIAHTYYAYTRVREAIRNGNNVYTATGRLIAVRREAFKNITVSDRTISNDHYVYFHVLTQGFEYRYADSALVYFRLPQTLKDHINQETRFSAAEHFMRTYFDPALVDREYLIPPGLFMKEMLIETMHYPVHCITAYMLNIYCKIRSYIIRAKINALWDMVKSTKHVSL